MDVKVIKSAKRRRTISAKRVNGKILLYVSDTMSDEKIEKCIDWAKKGFESGGKLRTISKMINNVSRNLYIALPELDRMCHLLELSDTIKEECAHLYKQVVEKGLVKGRSIKSVIGAIIKYVSTNKGEPRTLAEISKKSMYLFSIQLANKQYLKDEKVHKEISRVFKENKHLLTSNSKISQKSEKEWTITDGTREYMIKGDDTQLNIYRSYRAEIIRSYMHILKSMNLKPPKTNVWDYISLYSAKIGISNTAKEEAHKILEESKKYGATAGVNPSGVAGAIIRLACERVGEKFPEKDFLDLVGITPTTLHNRYDDVRSRLRK